MADQLLSSVRNPEASAAAPTTGWSKHAARLSAPAAGAPHVQICLDMRMVKHLINAH